jgi:hypothetical protein
VAPIVLVLAAALPLPSAAQVGVEASLVPAFESLSPEGEAAESRVTIDGDLEAEALFAGEKGRLSYALDAGTFSSPGDWSYFQHDAGLTWRVGATERPHAFLGVSGTLRRNGDAWAAADYDAVGARLNTQWSPRAGLTVRAGVRADARRFAGLPPLDQEEARGFLSVLVNLPSRTTLIGEVLLGGKSYSGETLLVPVEHPASDPAPADPAGSGGSAGSASGRGKGRSVAGPALRPALLAVAEGEENAGQLTWLVRGAQSLGERTGLSLQYTRRTVFGGVPPVVVATPALLFEDGVYDDPYASDASAARAVLKHVFAGGAVAQAEGHWLDKAWAATVALDESGEPRADGALRADTVWSAGVSATVPVLGSRAGAVSVALELGWRLTRHRSNDAFYRYDDHGVRVGLSASY